VTEVVEVSEGWRKFASLSRILRKAREKNWKV
jgi:hypothetical protein